MSDFFVYEHERKSEGTIEEGRHHAAKIITTAVLDVSMLTAVRKFEKEILPRATRLVISDIGSQTFFRAGFVYQPDRGRNADRFAIEATMPDGAVTFLMAGKIVNKKNGVEVTHALNGGADHRAIKSVLYGFAPPPSQDVMVTYKGTPEAVPLDQRPTPDMMRLYLRDVHRGYGSPLQTFTYT